MLPLLIRITNHETGARVEAGFKRSPVRIGRNALNDLAIDESFVSQWHGLVRFDAEGTRFLDLGSTNGTFLRDDRLEKNVEVDLADDTVLEIGPLRLSFVRMALTDAQILPRRAAPFSLGGTTRAARGLGAGGTVELAKAASKSAEELAKTFSHSLRGSERVPSMDELRALAERQRELVARLRPIYERYAAARQELDAAMAAGLEGTSSTERELSESLLRDSFPLAFEGGGADGAVGEWIELLAPSAAAKLSDPRKALQRAGAILEAFASAYLDLRAGERQVRTELGVEVGGEVESLPRFDDSRALLAYLFDPEVDAALRMDELARAFADVAVHELGIVRGAVEGARALLTVLSPQGVGAESPGALARTSIGFGDLLWPFRAAGNYYRYVAKHLEVATGEKFTTYLFGSAFGRAYYRVTGSRR